MTLKTTIDLQVPFYDVDIMAIVWHGHYVKYFELARCALLDKIDYNYEAMRDSGYFWPVIDLNLRYIKPARFGQWLTVSAELVEWEHRLKIKYLVVDKESHTKLTKGYSVQVAVHNETQEMCFLSPAILLEKLQVITCG
jgi:acyl-CoA thioester hydrolase